MKQPAAVLITDSCVLIDYAKSGRDALRILAHVVRVVVPRILLVEEVNDLSLDDAVSLGLDIYDPSIECLAEAARMPRPFSEFDWLCLILARDNGWTCVSNDKKLRSQCAAEGVKTKWSLEPLLMLVEKKRLTKARAEKIAKEMAEQNRFLGSQVFARFISRIRRVKN